MDRFEGEGTTRQLLMVIYNRHYHLNDLPLDINYSKCIVKMC